jgi:hypothetical protein
MTEHSIPEDNGGPKGANSSRPAGWGLGAGAAGSQVNPGATRARLAGRTPPYTEPYWCGECGNDWPECDCQPMVDEDAAPGGPRPAGDTGDASAGPYSLIHGTKLKKANSDKDLGGPDVR